MKDLWLLTLRFLGIFSVIHYENNLIEVLGITIIVYSTLKLQNR